MVGFSCNACNKEFSGETEQKLHYKSEWHRYNLKRKVAGVPGVTESLFIASQSALAQEKSEFNENPMLYSCTLCGKGYRSSKAHAQHLNSRVHVMRASQRVDLEEKEITIVRPLKPRPVLDQLPPERESDEEIEWEEGDEESEWEEEAYWEEDWVGDAIEDVYGMNVNEVAADEVMYNRDDDYDIELNPSCCFMCDQEHKNIEDCIVHLHKQHGFFIPDVEYLKHPEGLFTCLFLMVKWDYMCLYCSDRSHPFNSLEAVRKHMEAKGHCKIHYRDGSDAELERFYDYSSSYVNEDGKQLVAMGDVGNIELGSNGSELIVTRTSEDRTSTRVLGSREYMRCYHQNPHPSSASDTPVSVVLAARYRSMELATAQSKERMVRMKVLKQIKRSSVEAMRSKLGMKSNVIRNLPRNCSY